MKIALLVDEMAVTRWQADALALLDRDTEFLVYNCTNSPAPRRQFRHWPYYLLNLLSLRSAITARVTLPNLARSAPRTDFQSEFDGHWQLLPQRLLDCIRADRPGAVVKFGMGLLKIPENMTAPVLSYHHGDPRRFRGRPAGFYELFTGETMVGQVVQILSNRLDAGQVVAFAETPVIRHSYRATMKIAYRTSPLLLKQALRRAIDGEPLNLVPDGKAYRLPAPFTVMRFALQRLSAAAKRFAYGALIEKRWEVATAPLAFRDPPSLAPFPAKDRWQVVKRPIAYRFLADPFPHPSGEGLLVEAMRKSNGLGEILHIEKDQCRTIAAGNGHFSYPATLRANGSTYIIPETCQWSEPLLFRLDRDGAQQMGPLNIVGSPRLVDPTLIARDGTIFLFANDYSEGDFVLRLWCAKTIADQFKEHPASPILISPCGARMGGAVIQAKELYRVGQDGSCRYGDGAILYRIDELSPERYRETKVDEIRIDAVHGPHTLNFFGETVIFDYYHERFSPLAGVHRLRNKAASR